MLKGVEKLVMISDVEHGEEWMDGEAVQGVAYKSSDGTTRVAKANLTIVCDGMYSNLRSKLSQPKIKHPSFFVGLLLRNCSLTHPNFGHVVLAKPSPILFYPISSTEVPHPLPS
jgi:squalene monooxygenase